MTPLQEATAQMKNLMDSGRFAEAIPVGRHALTMAAPSDHGWRNTIYYNLGVCYNELGRYNEAEESYATSCRESPGDSAAWHNRANNDYRWGMQLLLENDLGGAHTRKQHALDCLRLAKKISPDDPDIDRLMALVQSSLP